MAASGELNDDDRQRDPVRDGLLQVSDAPTGARPSASLFDTVDGWVASSPNLVSYTLMLNSTLLFVLLIVCLVMYHRVQATLDKVDAMTSLNPFPH